MIPRLYQSQIMREVLAHMRAGRRRIIISLGTGGGKTAISAFMIKGSIRRKKTTLFLAHRRELIEQTSRHLDALGLTDHGIIMADHPRTDPTRPLQVGSIQTVWRRDPKKYDFIFCDECHRSMSKTFQTVLEKAGDPWVVGLSATPYRGDGHGLGNYYHAIVHGPAPSELVELGYLVPVVIYAPPMDAMKGAKKGAGKSADYLAKDLESRINKKVLIGNIVDHWHELARDERTVAFSVSVEHAKNIRDAFRERGINAEYIHAKTKKDERRDILARLRDGDVRVVANCAVLTEGWDCPPVSCAIIARPTLSRGLWRQMAGRILRPCEGKDHAIIQDHGGNFWRHGHIMEQDYIRLEMTRKEAKSEIEESMALTIICKKCFGVYYAVGNSCCPYCGTVATPGAGRKIHEKAGKLKKVEGPIRKNASPEEIVGKLKSLREVARSRDYKPGWVYWRMVATYGEDKTKLAMRE